MALDTKVHFNFARIVFNKNLLSRGRKLSGSNQRRHISEKNKEGRFFFKSGLHIVGRIISMCLRPCPKEYITAFLRCRLQKSLVRDCCYQKHVLPCEKKTTAS